VRDFPDHRRGVLGRPYQFWPTTTSTNDVLKEWARGGAPHGAVVAADFQHQGRGRRGRVWEASPGEAILASVLLRRDLGAAKDLGLWSLLWAVAVAEAAEAAAGVPVGVKWPNDVEVAGGKLAGILVEASLVQGAVEFLVVGIGVNVLQKAFPPDPVRPRVSLRMLTGREVGRAELLADILWRGEGWADTCRDADGRRAMLEQFRARSQGWLGREVTVTVGEKILYGRASGVDDQGLLILETEEGTLALPVGEVSLRPAPGGDG
jgi:BirA family biotin operon repressor/biotin-[acetyl-CoA-carboxylase] ligase